MSKKPKKEKKVKEKKEKKETKSIIDIAKENIRNLIGDNTK